MSKILEIGEYILKEGTTIERTGSFVSVRPIIKYTNKPRCSDCKYFSHGRATKCGYTTTVCLLQPKNITDKDGKDLYYHIGQRQIACSKFTKKLFLDTIEVKDPYEQCIQYASVKDGIEAHAEVYSFNIESELFFQLTKEQQKLWRKEIEQACISGGNAGYLLARDPRYKENLETKD